MSFRRVMRGGSWGNDARGLRSGYRGGDSPGGRDYGVGFRLVRTPVSLNPLTVLPSEDKGLAFAIAKMQAVLDELKKEIKK
jgi:hypothetical protein